MIHISQNLKLAYTQIYNISIDVVGVDLVVFIYFISCHTVEILGNEPKL